MNWQLLLWIVAILMACAPVVVFTVSWIMAGYFKAKENHMIKMTKLFSEAFEAVVTDMAKRKQEQK